MPRPLEAPELFHEICPPEGEGVIAFPRNQFKSSFARELLLTGELEKGF